MEGEGGSVLCDTSRTTLGQAGALDAPLSTWAARVAALDVLATLKALMVAKWRGRGVLCPSAALGHPSLGKRSA